MWESGRTDQPFSQVHLPSGARQEAFTHGHFEWVHYPDDVMADGILVARVTIQPNERWPEHLHGGYEQMLYVISGQGEHWVNGARSKLTEGTVHYLPAGAVHTMVNTGDAPLVQLSVYNPRVPEAVRELTMSMQRQGAVHEVLNSVGLSDLVSVTTMQTIQDKFAAAVGLGVLAIKEDGEVLTEPTGLPRFCQYVRSSCQRAPTCRAFSDETGRAAHGVGRPMIFNCCIGVVCVAVPLVAGSELKGHMVCGFVNLAEPNDRRLAMVRQKALHLGLDPDRLQALYGEIEVVLQAQMMTAADSLASIANSIVSLSMREMERSMESKHVAEMLQKLQQVSRLEKALQEAELRAMEARIKPHFLFNALNTIAATVSEGGREAEEIVYSLSDFLRFSLRHREPTATLSEELTCLRNYMNIQHARFGEDLQCRVVCAPGTEHLVVPSMILQPLAENAIVHGLTPRGYRGVITTAARVRSGRLIITVADSGVGLDSDRSLDLPLQTDESEDGPGIGLRYVKMKLQQVFEDDYRFAVRSRKDRGTAVTIDVPAREVTVRCPRSR